MAEIGKGDPRWIVNDRVDGRNVNAWHWTERDCTKWFKNRLTEELKNISLSSYGECKTKSVEKLEGEMTYCNRKRKHMFFYELELRIKWEACIDEKKITGQIRVPSICDEEPIDSMEIRVTTTSKTKEGDILREKIKNDALPALRDLIQRVVNETKDRMFVFSDDEDLIREYVDFKEPLPDEASQGTIANGAKQQHEGVLVERKPIVSKSFKDISMKLLFYSSPELMYQCLMDDQRLSFFTQSAAKMERKEGGSFSLFGGQVTGTNKKLVENQEIVQDWRFQTWPEGHHSTVCIKIQQANGGTEVQLEQTGVPLSDYERTLTGWTQHFWDRIQAVFGFTYKKL